MRTELTGPTGPEIRARGEALLAIGHMTDLHVTDVESPARFEFLNRFAGDSRFRELLTMQRPQEALNSHAIAAMVRAINAIEAAPVSGSPIELLVMTGDAIDNAQANEFATYTALFEGGMVNPASGGIEIESVQSPGWPDGIFWKPDGGGFGPDHFRVAYGFPLVPGLLDRAMPPPEAEVRHGQRSVDGGVQRDGDDHLCSSFSSRPARRALARSAPRHTATSARKASAANGAPSVATTLRGKLAAGTGAAVTRGTVRTTLPR